MGAGDRTQAAGIRGLRGRYYDYGRRVCLRAGARRLTISLHEDRVLTVPVRRPYRWHEGRSSTTDRPHESLGVRGLLRLP